MATYGCASFAPTHVQGVMNPLLRNQWCPQSSCHRLPWMYSPTVSMRAYSAYRVSLATFSTISDKNVLQGLQSVSLCNGFGWRRTIPGSADFSGRVFKTQKSRTAGGIARAYANEHVISLVVAIAIPLVAGVASALLNNTSSTWYKLLKKPSYNPPDWLFGIAWGILYPVMGLASWLVWSEGGFRKQAYPLTAYVVQLVINLLWPFLFFTSHKIKLALIDISVLLVAVAVTAVLFKPVNPLAAYLFIPYFAWVAFATFLNYKYLELNGRIGETFVSPA